MKRCHYVNHCLICNHLRKQKVLSQMNPYRQIILDNDGRNILLTFTLRHHQSHSFEFLQKILIESIGLLRTSRTFSKKLFPSKHRLYVLTEYEISWSTDKPIPQLPMRKWSDMLLKLGFSEEPVPIMPLN